MTEKDQEIIRLKTIIEELKSGYHMPEKQITYGNRVEIYTWLGKLWQDIFDLKLRYVDEGHRLSWVMAQIEMGMAHDGSCGPFGKVGEMIKFSPHYCEYVRGMEPTIPFDERVLVKIPGFKMQSPYNEEIIVLRMRVTRVNI